MKFDLYIPCVWDRFPFLLLVCRGSHSHAPPQPTKLPHDVSQEIIDAITTQDIQGLTARDSALRYIHKSLQIEDRVTAFIHKQRLLYYPGGTNLAGVWREYQFDLTKNVDDQWIREVYFFDREHYLIICCTFEQAKLFQSVRHIEIDLAFKMVQGQTKVFTISGWNERVNSKFLPGALHILMLTLCS